jgi:DNA primase
VKKERDAESLSIEGRSVRVTHPDKLYFSKQTQLSKLDLVRYYLSIAPGALAGIRDRPLVLKRFVNGAEQEAFYQKRAPAERPPWLRTATLAFPSGPTAEELVVDDAAGLAWVVNLGCIELHPHPVRSGDLEQPDELRVDLDPGPGVSWGSADCSSPSRVASHRANFRVAALTPGKTSNVQIKLAAKAIEQCDLLRCRFLEYLDPSQ